MHGRIGSLCCMCVLACARTEQRSIKRAIHLTDLCIFSMENLCFQLSHHYPSEPERERDTLRERMCSKMTAKGKSRRYCNEEMEALGSSLREGRI